MWKRSLKSCVVINTHNMIWQKIDLQLDVQFDCTSCVLAILQVFRHDISSLMEERYIPWPMSWPWAKIFTIFFWSIVSPLESVVRSNTSHPGPLLSSIYLFNFRLKIPNISPSPFLNCASHPVCCKVVHVSGATKHVEKVRQDTDRMGVLASSDILSFKSLSLASVDVEG